MKMRTPSPGHIVDLLLSAASHKVKKALPVIVEAFDPVKRTVEVQAQVKYWLNYEYTRYPKMTNVPVAYPRGGGFFMAWPIQPGDTGFVITMDQSIDEWLVAGGETEPASKRRHSFSDAVFIPGVSPLTHVIPAFDGTDLVIGREDGTVAVRMTKTGKVAIGNEAVDLLDFIYAVVTAMIGDSLVVSGTASPSGDAVTGTAVFSPPTIAQVMAKLAALETIKEA